MNEANDDKGQYGAQNHRPRTRIQWVFHVLPFPSYGRSQGRYHNRSVSHHQSCASSARDSIAAIVRAQDRDRFLTALFAPQSARGALMALYAFNYEIAKTREVVREPMLGRIRLEWWRESVDAIYAGAPLRRHDVVAALAAAAREKNLTRAHLERLIDARERDLLEEPPADLAALEAYARESSVPLVLLALEALGVRDAAAAAAAEGIGMSYALVGLMRAAGFHARLRRSWLPADLVAAEGVALETSLFALKWVPGLGAVARTVAARARSHLEAARARAREVPRAALPALLPGVLATRTLRTLERAGYDLLSPALARPDGGRSLALALAALRGRY
jgi:NADH dehydrogenase [ubiquinone] 1 alpha subcomplex assembly factor 6